MKKRKYVYLPLLSILIFATAVFVSGQTKKAKQAKKSVVSAETWQEIKWTEQGLQFSLPPQFKAAEVWGDGNPTRPDGYVSENRDYERTPGSEAGAARFTFTVHATNWKGETVKTEIGGKEVTLTPQDMLVMDYLGDQKLLAEKASPLEEVSYWEIGGVNGTYVVGSGSYDAPKDKSPNAEIKVIWGTYRVYKGSVQRIWLTARAQRRELPTIKKIIGSAKFLD